MVTNILRLNKRKTGNSARRPRPFDLCRQLCDCALRFEALWERKGIDFQADVEDRAIVTADADMLEIVWNNLLSNAGNSRPRAAGSPSRRPPMRTRSPCRYPTPAAAWMTKP